MNNIYVFSKKQNFYAKTNSSINEYFNLGTILYLSMDKGKFYLDLGQVSSLCYIQTHVTHLVCNKTCYVMGQKVVELRFLLLPLATIHCLTDYLLTSSTRINEVFSDFASFDNFHFFFFLELPLSSKTIYHIITFQVCK